MMTPRRDDADTSSLVVGITGASGIPYSLRLLQHCDLIKRRYSKTFVILTKAAIEVGKLEHGIDLRGAIDKLVSKCDITVFGEDELTSPLMSSSRLVNTDMVIVPASMNTVAKLANGIQDNLLTRCALSILRMGGRLVLVIRETPLSAIDLENLLKLAKANAIILPASPAFYYAPAKIDDMLDFIVGKILDVLGVPHNLYKRWAATRIPYNDET